MKYLLTIMLIFTLSACATEANYRQSLQKWYGASITDLVESGWGAPDRTIKLPNGDAVYCYVQQEYSSTPAWQTPIMTYGALRGDQVFVATTGGDVYGGSVYHSWCRTCFITGKKNKIKKFTYSGNACVK